MCRSTRSSSRKVRPLTVDRDPMLTDDSVGPAAGSEWCIYDVGGSRTQRIAWYPYFDDCDAIIFLAPISCFDERLTEDRRINRLEDSFMLWKAVASSKLLSKTSIVLFLNKCDLLEQKLLNGVRIRDYVHSYGDRPNDIEHATKCESTRMW